MGTKQNPGLAPLKPFFYSKDLGRGVLPSLGADPGGGGAGRGGMGNERVGDDFLAFQIHKPPSAALEFIPVPCPSQVHRRQSLGEGKHLIVFRGDHELALAVDETPLSIGQGSATIFLKEVNLLKTGRNDHFPGFVDKAPLALPLHGGEALPEDGGILVLRFHQKFA